jgi:gluconokinase
LFDSSGAEQAGFGEQRTYHMNSTHDGGVEANPAELVELCEECLGCIADQLAAANLRPAAVAFDTFWHSFLGVGADGSATTPILHLFDTRSAAEVKELEGKLDGASVHERTGCRLHTSYWPSKLLWLAKHSTEAFQATRQWMGFGEYLYLRLFGKAVSSTSMASGTGLWNQATNDYDRAVLAALPIHREQVADPGEMDRPATGLTGGYGARWPMLDGIPWFPALGDGACNNIGSGCTTVDDFSLMVGTSGAMRAVIEQETVSIPDGLWCYRVDRRRYVLGGSLSNGGDVYAWMRRTLLLPSEAEAEKELQMRAPGEHGLLVLPFFAGERSPYWRADLRAVVAGLDLATRPIDILQAGMESVALRFRQIYHLMSESLGAPRRITASGGALLASNAWTQMMADALGTRVVTCLEHEATSRGAALLALERLGAIPNLAQVAFRCGPPREAKAENTAIYRDLQAAQAKLFQKIFVDS